MRYLTCHVIAFNIESLWGLMGQVPLDSISNAPLVPILFCVTFRLIVNLLFITNTG